MLLLLTAPPAVASADSWSSSPSSIVDLNTNGSSCLEVASGSLADGAKVQQWGCWGGPQQQWHLSASSVPGYFSVVNQNSGKCLEVAGGSTANGAKVQQWGCWNTTGQQWNGGSVAAAYAHATTPNSSLILDEEFNGAVGSQPGSPWTIVTGPLFGGTQCFVNDTAHVAEGWGQLVLTATYNPGGTPCGGSYESGSVQVLLSTWSYLHGTAEARIKVPCQSGTGVWPAWWQFYSANEGSNANGEIDSLEIGNRGVSNPGQYVSQTMHAAITGDGPWQLQRIYHNPIGQDWCNNWHVFGNVWKPGEVDLTTDGVVTAVYTTGQMQPGWTWPFETYPEGPVLSLLVGGYGGTPNPGTFPQNMIVDWVRIWR